MPEIDSGPRSLGARLHGRLMPDYSRRAALYWWFILLLGVVCLAGAAWEVAGLPPAAWAQIAASALLAVGAGMLPLRVPGSTNAFAAGDIFIFFALLQHGVGAGVLVAAAEAAVATGRASKRWTSRLASPAMAAIAMTAVGMALDQMLAALQQWGLNNDGVLLGSAALAALAYFGANTCLMTLLPYLKRREWPPLLQVLRGHGWFAMAIAGSASLATLLVITARQSGLVVLLAAVPLIALLLAASHYYFRQRSAEEQARQAREEAAQREAQQRLAHLAALQHQAFHDGLTGLPNRHRFNELLGQAIERVAEPQPDTPNFQVLFLDFDRFKMINDSMGHGAGDRFLVNAGRRISENLRPGDVVARLGGDEFAILAWLGPSTMAFGQHGLAQRLLTVLSQPVQVGDTEVASSVSIGITDSRIGYTSAEQILRDADIAMYRAKARGKGRFEVFDTALRDEVSEHVALERDLRRALESDALDIAYQPLYDLADGRLLGFEALARWTDPVRGPVSPGQFIPVAEESGAIRRITDLVLLRACSQLQAWRERHPVFSGLSVHVNLATMDVAQPQLLSRVNQALARSGLPAACLTLELTENILMEHLSAAIGTLHELRRLGVGLAVDDFGTGYSSLAHLSSLPIDSLKIDGSFVHHLDEDARRAAVVRAIVLLGQSLGKTVVAEGIETEAQRSQLAALGCGVGQGYHLGRPQPAAQVDALLARLANDGSRAGAVVHLPASQRAARWRA